MICIYVCSTCFNVRRLCVSTESTGPAKVVRAGNPPKGRRGGKVRLSARLSVNEQNNPKYNQNNDFLQLYYTYIILYIFSNFSFKVKNKIKAASPLFLQ